MRLNYSLVVLLVLTGGIYAQTPSASMPSPTPNAEALDWCNAEVAYDVMLGEPQWTHANSLYKVLLDIKSRVTPEQRTAIRALFVEMAGGPRRPDDELLNYITDDFAEGAALRKLTIKQKAGLAIRMQSAMAGVNDDYLPNVSTSLAFIANTFNDAGMSTKSARKIVDHVYAMVAKSRSPK